MEKLILPNEILIEETAKLLDEGTQVILCAKGNSMRPYIRDGKDSVLLVRADSVQPGDVVLARIAPKRYVLHRLRKMEGDVLTLKGDGNLDGTEKCRRQDIIGVATRIIRPSGKSVPMPSARLWLSLGRFPRRVFLGVVRRLEKILK
ncbi:MAG: S24/S26 family peptidase [Bacteroidales bacterium]|nr:S24/S26 family peptidase [Bacteroidales bacterium]